jgi:hypothetical protein
MAYPCRWAVALLALACLLPRSVAQETGKFTLKTAATAPPTVLSAPIRKELAEPALQLYDPAGKLVAELWTRKAIPAEVKPEQAKKGVTYRDLKQGELFGAIQFHQGWKDYRKHKIKAGVYTLRLAVQPTDGKHTADISEYPDFLLLVGPKDDTQPGPIDPMKLPEIAGDSIGSSHPGVFMLAPNPNPTATPELAARPRSQWVVNTRSELLVGGRPAGSLGIGLTLVGHTPSE